MSQPQQEPKFVCAVCGQILDNDSASYVMAHAQSHTPSQNAQAIDFTFTALMKHIDETITRWSEYPAGLMNCLYESDDCKLLLRGNARTQDMLSIRLRCAEEFKRVAEEYNRLLKARLEVDV